MKKYYVYSLTDPRTTQPFYIGKGSGGRIYSHVRDVMNEVPCPHNPKKFQLIKEILDEGLQVEHKILEYFDTSLEAQKHERHLIHTIGRVNQNTGPLLNVVSGDEKPQKTERKIHQYTFFGDFVREFSSTNEACEILGIKHSSSLANAVRGRSISYAGYIWCYADESPRIPKSIIYQWDMSGHLVAKHKNEGEASRCVNCAQAQLHYHLDRPGFTQCKGFVFSRTPTFPGYQYRAHEYKVWEKGHSNKPVIHTNTNRVYETVTKAAKATKHNTGDVSRCCKTGASINGDFFEYFIQLE